jgi:hypothetical protein
MTASFSTNRDRRPFGRSAQSRPPPIPRPERVTVPIETARSHLNKEVTQLRTEQQAFKRCAECGATLTVQPHTQSPTNSAVTPIAETPAAATTHDVWAAYHETVMALAHYDDVYDDSLTTSLAQECGAEIATALGEETPLTALLQQRVSVAAIPIPRADWVTCVLSTE